MGYFVLKLYLAHLRNLLYFYVFYYCDENSSWAILHLGRVKGYVGLIPAKLTTMAALAVKGGLGRSDLDCAEVHLNDTTVRIHGGRDGREVPVTSRHWIFVSQF